MIDPHFLNGIFVSLSLTKNAFIWEEDRCPYKSFQNNFSSDSATL